MIGIERNHASRWWRLARSSWFGFVVDGPEAESYRDAERFKMEGEEERRLGAGAEKDARFEERHVDLAAATTFLVGAESHYVEAEQGFTASSKVLKGIESRDRKSTGTKP